MVQDHRLYEQLKAGLPGAGIETSAILGAFVKNVSTAGLVTLQQADGTEATVQLQTGGGGGGGGNTARLLTAVPGNGIGADGDVALVRTSPLVVHAYQKIAGAWVRQWAFHGGDSVLLATLPTVPDRKPATDPDSTIFARRIGISGFSPVTQLDINQSNGVVNAPADLRGGNHANVFGARANTLPSQSFGTNLADYTSGINFGAAVPLYLWFGLEADTQSGLSVASVSYNGVDIPVTKQADQVTIFDHPIDVWVADATRVWSEINAHPFVLTVVKDAAAPQHLESVCGGDTECHPGRGRFLARERANQRVHHHLHS